MLRALLACVFALLFAAACEAPLTAEPELSCEISTSVFDPWYGVDLLFVLDTSPAMSVYADRLRANLLTFANVLENVEGGLPSLHVAVVSSDGQGVFQTGASDKTCVGIMQDSFLIDTEAPWWLCSDNPWPRCGVRNYSGTLADTLSCMGSLPIDPDTTPTPLASLRRALDGSQSDADGFLRPRAWLAVVVISPSDDSSTGTVDEYASFLRSLKPDPQLAIVSIVAPSSATRLVQFKDAFPQRNTIVSIDDDDWRGALIQVANLLARVTGFPCLTGADQTDIDREMPGLQLDCAVSDIHYSTQAETAMPPCRMLTSAQPDPTTPLPCWWVGEGIEFGCDEWLRPFIERIGPAPPGTSVVMRCVSTCADKTP